MHASKQWVMGGLAAVVGVVVAMVVARWRGGEAAPGAGVPDASSTAVATTQPATPAGNGGASPAIDAVTAAPVLADEISEAEMTPFLRSEIAAKWQEELGYTMAQMLEAQQKIRAQRYPEETVNDPGTIMRHLPPRHQGQVSIRSVRVDEVVQAGQPVRFSIEGTAPSPSFTFTRFDINVQPPVVRIRARGHAEGETDAGPGGTVRLDGTIDPLPPGDYRIEIAELGPMGIFPFRVDE
ncbi:MAG TPA: hypothetical protein PKC67_04060 [Kiritimatiellia bacterium]|nr:hypothetical protein [Kiritimatiellia bacterium]HMP33503.1 hypothetical protein [Kiritimatiellia bacterium]